MIGAVMEYLDHHGVQFDVHDVPANGFALWKCLEEIHGWNRVTFLWFNVNLFFRKRRFHT